MVNDGKYMVHIWLMMVFRFPKSWGEALTIELDGFCSGKYTIYYMDEKSRGLNS